MNPDEILMQRLTAELADAAYDGLTQAEGFALLNATENVETTNKPMAFTMAELLSFLKPASATKLVDWPMLGDLRDKVTAQDHAGVIAWLSFINGTKITQEEFQQANAYLTRTESVEVRTPIESRAWRVIRGIPGGPNVVSEEQFAAAWLAVGRA